MAKRTSWLRAAVAPLLWLAGAACATYSDVRFAPAPPDVELRGTDGDLQARVIVVWRGIEEREGVLELRFRMRVENPGPTPFTLVPAGFELLDGALTPFGPAAPEVPTRVDAGRSATFDLAFPVPAGSTLESYDLSMLTLRTRFQAEHWDWSTSLQRVEPHEPSPAWGFSFGLGIGL